MNKESLIELGKQKVIEARFEKNISQVPSKALEILGNVLELEFSGFGGELEDRLKEFQENNMVFEFEFYEYVNGELHKCSLKKAISTNEFQKYNILLFSQIEDTERKFYLEIL